MRAFLKVSGLRVQCRWCFVLLVKGWYGDFCTASKTGSPRLPGTPKSDKGLSIRGCHGKV